MQNSSTSIDMSSGCGVNPSADDPKPSWNTTTMIPSVAPSVSALQTSARRGWTMLPVNRNRTTNVVSTTRAMANGSRSPTEARLSTSAALAPPTSASVPSGSATPRTAPTRSLAVWDFASALVTTASRSLDWALKVATAGLCSASSPLTKVPALESTRSTADSVESCDAYSASGVASTGPVVTTSIAVVSLLAKPSRIASPTCRLAAVVGRTRSSGVPNSTDNSGNAAATRTATTAPPASHGRRITRAASRPQKGAAALRGRRSHGSEPAFTRVPSTHSNAGSATSAPRTAMATTPIPAYANDRKKYRGNTSNAASAAATASPLNMIVRP